MERILLTEANFAECVSRAVTVLSEGGLVIYPTETVYGVGADALSAEAVSNALAYKNRPAGMAIAVLVADAAAARELVEPSPEAERAYETFLPGPVTVVSRNRGVVDGRLPSELGTLGIRISSHPFAAALAKEFRRPITTTSANPTGGARPYDIDSLLAQLSDTKKARLSLIIDAGTLPKREPSTVIDTTGTVQEVLRAGAALHDIAPALRSSSVEETMALAEKFMAGFTHALPEKPVIFALEGEMGMGKTHFAKGVAKALGVTRVVTSPTYSLVKEYPGEVKGAPVRFVHMDCWRAGEATAEEVGMPEYAAPRTVTVIEWALPLLPYLKSLGDDAVTHRLVFEGDGENRRTIRVVSI